MDLTIDTYSVNETTGTNAIAHNIQITPAASDPHMQCKCMQGDRSHTGEMVNDAKIATFCVYFNGKSQERWTTFDANEYDFNGQQHESQCNRNILCRLGLNYMRM